MNCDCPFNIVSLSLAPLPPPHFFFFFCVCGGGGGGAEILCPPMLTILQGGVGGGGGGVKLGLLTPNFNTETLLDLTIEMLHIA